MANSQTFRVSEITRVYAIGDCSSAFRPAVHNIAAAIPTLAANIYRDLLFANGIKTDVPEDRLFKEDTRETQMVPIGTKGGVGASWGWVFPSWAVWLLKGRDYWLWTTPALWSGKQWNKAS
jgi:NADH dehydrogenase FAD-containing subunit